jgi:autophagy-related ATG14-like protein
MVCMPSGRRNSRVLKFIPISPPPVARQRLRVLRENLATRRRTLSQAKLLPPAPLDPLIAREVTQLNARAETIARARSGLVSELVEVFNIVEVGGRPPIGGKAGTKGEWTIGDLVLPVPGDIRRTCFHILFCSFQAFLLVEQGTPPTISMRL